MDTFGRIKLRIVDAESVRPHEIADPGREQRIERRLQEDGVLRDPVIVGEIHGMPGYVLLDGTNRKRALAALGLHYLVAQIIDYHDEHSVQLRTWCHAADMPIALLLEAVSQIAEVSVMPVAPLGAHDALRQPGVLALLLDRNEQHTLLLRPNSESSATGLRHLIDLYEHRMERVDCGADDVEERAQSLSEGKSLVAFPGFTRSQVATMTMRGTLIPAGITRHVIHTGRALRVNVPLEMLSGESTVAKANSELEAHLDALHPRLYQEPTILFDS